METFSSAKFWVYKTNCFSNEYQLKISVEQYTGCIVILHYRAGGIDPADLAIAGQNHNPQSLSVADLGGVPRVPCVVS